MTRTDYYNNPMAPKANSVKPATSAIVTNSKGEILLQRRVDNQQWGLPGGTMEPGESIVQCLIREVKEETGLDVQPAYLIGLYSDPAHVIAYTDGEVRQQFSMCFYCILQGGTLKASAESTQIGFYAVQTLDALNIPPAIRLRIDHYLEQREHPYFC
ncbi:putative MutT/NUDIX-like protein [Dictyobacter alpinus]|uniref:Putative MutT/NUDIX-like protein n=1 Tax=Dictyobacter alpinus TaxID=2014873 RepID=A0A402B8N0_9CHLR|nr:NUDIX domain-containing protein [Dictyobacter alpinus]GCE27705.1 putative MutT/NUDIX-like protein [Dictyobacter alpinus]